MGISYGSFASGLLGGYNLMSNIQDRKTNQASQKVQSQINQLQLLNEERKIKIQEQQQDYQNFNNSLSKGESFFKIGNKIKDNTKYQEYTSKISTLPFFEKAQPSVKLMLSAMSELPREDNKQWFSIVNNFQKAQQNNNKDEMFSSLYEGMALYGDNPKMKPFLDFAEKQLMPTKKGFSRSTVIDPETGEVTILEGEAAQQGALTRGTETHIQKKVFNATESLAKMQRIQQSYNERFYSAPGIIKANFLQKKEHLTGERLKGENKKFVEGFTEFAQNVTTLSTEIVNDLFGSALTRFEYSKMHAMIPLFTGSLTDIVTGKGASAFETQMNEFEEMIQLTIARRNYILNSGGFSSKKDTSKIMHYDSQGQPIPLDKMKTIMNEAANTIRTQIKASNSDISENDLRIQIAIQLKEIFGL